MHSEIPTHFSIGRPPETTLSPEDITRQIDKILGSPAFRGSERARELLRYLVDQALDGRPDQVTAYSIARNLLGRPSNFDPGSDPIVRIQAGRLRRTLELYYLTTGAQDDICVDLPRGSYLPTFVLVAPQPQIAPPADLGDLGTVDPKPSLVILPFEDLSPGQNWPALAHALGRQILAALTPFDWLRVFLQTEIHPAGSFTRSGVDLRGGGLSAYVLAGTVDQADDSLGITLTLHDARSGQVLWSKTRLDLQVNRVGLVAQQELSARLAAVLADFAGVIPRAIVRRCVENEPTQLPLYDASFCYMNTVIRSHHHYTAARQVLEKALSRYPDHPFGHALLCQASIHDHNYCFGVFNRPLDRALEHARRAVALAPQNQLGELLLAVTYLQRGSLEQFRVHAERAVQLNPNCSYCLGSVGLSMSTVPEWDEGLPLIQRAMELNPYYPRFFHFGPYLHHFDRAEYEEALAEARHFDLPDFFWSPLVRAAALGQLDRREEGRAAIEELLALRPDFPAKAHLLVSRSVISEELLGRMLQGLERAGLPT